MEPASKENAFEPAVQEHTLEIETGIIDPNKPTYVTKTDKEIADLAKRLYRNEIFVSWQIRNPNDLPMVFMPLMFIDEITRRQWLNDNIQFFYEEYNQAGPRGINGYPFFMSMNILNREDGLRLHAKVGEIMELLGDNEEERNGE